MAPHGTVSRSPPLVRPVMSSTITSRGSAPAPAAFSIEASAEYLGVSRSSIWRLIKAGTLPCVRLGGRTLLRRVDLDALLAHHVRAA
ncbi:helix-turn-helix domain-containing protein [Methylobacterium iners]|uniref:helix-turn-helix domain-containing protein n=1 Tax=Methylobacterium iners TaxID=418707 RepID=UPI002795C3C3|nr:helix-turn-helix domain-containing protein [Methylobacterium iners]